MSEKSKILIGVDNGVSGALAALSPHGQLMALLPMPTAKARRRSEIDVCAIWCWLDEVTAGTPRDIVIIIEEPGGSKSASAAASMEGSFQSIRALCELLKIRWHRITPQKWQRVMLPGAQAGETKARALTAARALWPDQDWLASPRCRVPHDGLVDAALIAEFGRRELEKSVAT